jgi:hypothetical protein
MRIKVNDEVVEIFSGACVKDAVLKYSRTAWKQVRKGKRAVFDLHGHEVAPDGELSGGEELYVRVPDPEGRES